MFDNVFPLAHRVLFTLSRGTYGGPFLLNVPGLAYNNTQRVHPGHRRSQKPRLGAAILFSSCLHFFLSRNLNRRICLVVVHESTLERFPEIQEKEI